MRPLGLQKFQVALGQYCHSSRRPAKVRIVNRELCAILFTKYLISKPGKPYCLAEYRMDWEEEDVTQRFASNLVPRQTPTKQEEELLKSKVEARRLLMKLNGALDNLRMHMLPEIEEDDDEDSSGPEAAIHRQTKSTFGGRRRRGGESENHVSRRKHTEAEYDDHRRSPKRPEWNTRFQPTDSPLDYELPRHKKGFLPASPSKTLRNGSAKTQRRRNVSTKKTMQWDSRIIATRSALDDIPRYPPKPFRKKRVVSVKDLEHLAAHAPTASL